MLTINKTRILYATETQALIKEKLKLPIIGYQYDQTLKMEILFPNIIRQTEETVI